MFASTDRRRPLALLAAGLIVASAAMGPARADAVGAVTMYPAGSPSMAIAAGPDGNLWVTLTSGAIGRVTTDGVLTQFPAGLSVVGPNPSGITAGPDGNLWFVDRVGNRIGRITPTGTITFFSEGLTTGAAPQAITAGPDGNVWFTESGVTKIGRITPAGVISEFGTGLSGTASDIAAGADGNLWFTEGVANKIGRITGDGDISEFSAGLSPNARPVTITRGADANMWFGEYVGDRIGRVLPDGSITEFATGISPGAQITEIASGPDGNLWFTEAILNKIGRISTQGSIVQFAGVPTNPQGGVPQGIATGQDGSMWFTNAAGSGLGRVGTGKQPASLRPPAVTGALRPGGQVQCTGARWASWAGTQPTPTAVSWSLNGQRVPGASGWTFTPESDDVGKALTCTVAAEYPAGLIPVVATSDAGAIAALPTGATGPAGADGQAGATGAKGEPGRVVLVTCTRKKGASKRRCSTKVVSVSQRLRAGGAQTARLSAPGRTYRLVVAMRGGDVRLRTSVPIPKGQYMLHLRGRAALIRLR